MTCITRFAPSPTGFLHVGNLRTAIFNYLVSKKSGGRFILRLDDTDRERSSQLFSDQILRDLEWLGFEWDRVEQQSTRISHYETAAQKLRESGLLYECFETPKELEFKRRKQLSMGLPPVYDRYSLRLSSAQRNQFRAERRGYWRFKLDHGRIEWEDGIIGKISIDTGSVSDPVLIRADGQFLYTMASVVDDIDFGINYVIRGSDHVTNTATQIQLLDSFGVSKPSFAHHSLLVGPKGEPLSKRMNNLPLKDLKESGLEPQAILIFMASLGHQNLSVSQTAMKEVLENFNLSDFGSTPTKFDRKLLLSFSQKFLARLNFNEIEEDLNELGIPENLQVDFWDMAKENIYQRSDLKDLWSLCVEGVEPLILPEDKDFISVCKVLMPSLPRNNDSWSAWTNAIKSETGRSGKALFLPLRNALTGKDSGPDMNKLFPLMQKIRL